MAGKTGGSPSGGGFGGAVKSVGSRGASYITASQGRQTAFLLIMAIFLARLALTHQLQAFWAAMWGQSRPLGAALPKNVATANSKQTSKTQTSTTAGTAEGASIGAAAIIINQIFGGGK